MTTYAITGGAGFIGSHLADALLEAGHDIRIIDDFSTGRIENLDPQCTIVRGDVCDPVLVRKALQGVDGCYHLAAIASVARANEDWLGTHRVNLGGFINVMDAARQLGRFPVVYASSAAVYGKMEGIAREDGPASPMTAYGADKLACELHARAGALVHGVPSLGFRFFNVFGPRQDPASPYSGVISIFAQALTAGQAIQVHGTGNQTRDFIYVRDIVAHLTAGMRALNEGRLDEASLVLNACTGRETSIRQLAETIGDLLSSSPRMTNGPARAGDISRSIGSPEAAVATLGISARTTLREGLDRTLESLGAKLRLQRV